MCIRDRLEGEIDEFRRVGEPPDAAVSIKVGSQTYVVDTHHIDGMLKICLLYTSRCV